MSNTEELMAALDEELDNCIRKFRDATYGYEVRTFITEYEELMLKKSDMLVHGFIKKDREKHKGIDVPQVETTTEIINRAKKESRQAVYLSITAAAISVITSIIRIIVLT